MRKWSDRSLRNLRGIHPDLRRVLDRALQEAPFDFIVIEGLRTAERQRELYDQGASKTLKSRHLTGHAVDLLPIGPNGPRFDWPLYNKLAPAIKKAAKAEGVKITWGGDWTQFKDGPHFELDRTAYPETDWSSDEKPKERRLAQSKTVQASAAEMAAGGATVVTAVSALEGNAQLILVVVGVIVIAAGAFIMRERIKKWLSGER